MLANCRQNFIKVLNSLERLELDYDGCLIVLIFLERDGADRVPDFRAPNFADEKESIPIGCRLASYLSSGVP